jgi:adenylate cyclase
LKIGIGIHSGTAIIGNMGYNKATGLTAIGDVVNTASRLESLTKEYGVEFLVSEKTALLAGMDETQADKHTTNIKGRVEPMNIMTIKSASKIVFKETVPA